MSMLDCTTSVTSVIDDADESGVARLLARNILREHSVQSSLQALWRRKREVEIQKELIINLSNAKGQDVWVPAFDAVTSSISCE
jgi:hypothetical protein